jgi:hypothetical protein
LEANVTNAFVKSVPGGRAEISKNGHLMTKKVEIDRVHYKNLSLETFIHKYANPRKPVIITGMTLTRRPWTLEYLKRVCGEYTVQPMYRDANATTWGRLVEGDKMTLGEFIDTYVCFSRRIHNIYISLLVYYCLLGGSE